MLTKFIGVIISQYREVIMLHTLVLYVNYISIKLKRNKELIRKGNKRVNYMKTLLRTEE